MAELRKFPKQLVALKTYLRESQLEALRHIQRWFRSSDDSSYLVCMPTGTGKTGVIAIASLMFAHKDVLVVTPWSSLRSQLVTDLTNKFWKDSGIPSPGADGFEAVPFSGRDLEKKLVTTRPRTLWITTFQGLWTISRRERLYEKFKERLDLVVVDEGHYEPAIWWGRAVKGLKRKTLILTATPYRNDLKYFRISKASVFQWKYKTSIASGTIRDVKPLPLGEHVPANIELIINAIVKKWSKAAKKRLASRKPRMIVCCENFEAVKRYTLGLREKGISAIGIHHRATKKEIAEEHRDFFRSRVPKDPRKVKEDVWVHERMLTEGLDFPPFCALAVTWQMRNDRRLIQQIGRVVRASDDDRHKEAFVYEVNDVGVKNSWDLFMEFEDTFHVVTPEHFRKFLDKYLTNQPKLEYFGKRFRRRLVPSEMDAATARREVLTVPSVIVRKVPKKFDFRKFIDEVTDALQLEDYITIGPENDAPVVKPSDLPAGEGALWLYHRFSNSKTLLSHSAYEVKISALCVILKHPFLLLTDTESFVPIESLEEYSSELSPTELKRAFASGYIPNQVQLKNSLPHQSVIRGTVRSGPNLAEVPVSLSESKYICRSVRGRRANEGSRYVGFNTARISDDRVGMRRDAMCLDDLLDWSKGLVATLQSKAKLNPFFLRFARLVEPPQTVVPRYGFLDFWSGDFDLVDAENELLEPVDAVFEFEPEGHSSKVDAQTYVFKISGVKDGIEKTATIKAYWKNARFYFRPVQTEGLSIRESQMSREGQTTDFKVTDIASFCKRRHGDFFVSIERSNLVYNSGVFYEVDPANNYADIGDLFTPLPELNQPNLPEKNPTSKRHLQSWSKKTVFGVISSKSVLTQRFEEDYDLLVCDDGAGEIADFVVVSFDPPKIVLIHCKSKPRKGTDRELRAVSELQEVVSQASKNLLYLSGRSQYPPHIDQWDSAGIVDGFNVPRILKKAKKLPDTRALWTRIKEDVLLSRNSVKEVWIVVGGVITKKWLDDEIKKCRKADSNLACLFHMVDGLSSSCIEAKAELRVFCNGVAN